MPGVEIFDIPNSLWCTTIFVFSIRQLTSGDFVDLGTISYTFHMFSDMWALPSIWGQCLHISYTFHMFSYLWELTSIRGYCLHISSMCHLDIVPSDSTVHNCSPILPPPTAFLPIQKYLGGRPTLNNLCHKEKKHCSIWSQGLVDGFKRDKFVWF